MRTARILPLGVAAALIAAFAAACSDSPTGLTGPTPPRGVVVLNGFGQQGVTLVGDTGTTSTRLDFGAAFDGGGLAVARDTALSTSSKARGDQLYVADLVAGTVTRVQMPAGSNPGGADFTGGLGNASVAVTLRDTRALALVRTGASPSVAATIANVGRCPYDVAVQGGAFWVLDANLDCEGSYNPQGDSRLVRLSPDGTQRDTIVLTGVRNASSIVVAGGSAFVSSGGTADFSNWPSVTFTAPSSVTKVDLATRRVVSTRVLAPTSNGGGVRLGLDGRLYGSAYTSTDYATREVFALDQELNFVGTRATGRNSLALRLANGTAPACAGVTADALGRVYCPVNGAGSAATLHVFDATGTLLRSVPVGQGAVDVALR